MISFLRSSKSIDAHWWEGSILCLLILRKAWKRKQRQWFLWYDDAERFHLSLPLSCIVLKQVNLFYYMASIALNDLCYMPPVGALEYQTSVFVYMLPSFTFMAVEFLNMPGRYMCKWSKIRTKSFISLVQISSAFVLFLPNFLLWPLTKAEKMLWKLEWHVCIKRCYLLYSQGMQQKKTFTWC